MGSRSQPAKPKSLPKKSFAADICSRPSNKYLTLFTKNVTRFDSENTRQPNALRLSWRFLRDFIERAITSGREIMVKNDEAFLTITDIFSALRRHWLIAMFTSIVLTCLGGVFIFFVLRPTYSSQGSLFVRLGKNMLTVDPTVSSTQAVASLESRRHEVVSVKELLESRAVVDRVCNRIGVQTILDQRSDLEVWLGDVIATVKFSESKPPEGMTKEDYKAQKDLETAIKYVTKALDIESPKDSYNIHIEAKAHDPLVARDIVQFLMEEYQTVHKAAHKPSGSFGFFDEQVEEQRQNLVSLENKKRDELNRRNFLSVEAERQLIQGRVTLTSNRLSEVTSLLEGQRARVAELLSQIDSQAETLEIEQTGGIADTATDLIKSSVFALEVEHQKAAAMYNSSHPALIQKKQALAEAREIEGSQPQEREQRRNVINPNRMALELEYAKGIGELENFESQLGFLEAELGELKLREKQLNEDDIFFNDLERQIAIAESEFKAFSSKREQSKLTEAIDQENFTDVNIAQNATLNVTKNGISRMLMLALCFIGSTLAGGGTAIGREILKVAYSQATPVVENVQTPVPPTPKPRVVMPPTPARERETTQPVSPPVPEGTYRVYSGRFRVNSQGTSLPNDPKFDPIPES